MPRLLDVVVTGLLRTMSDGSRWPCTVPRLVRQAAVVSRRPQFAGGVLGCLFIDCGHFHSQPGVY
jgi:hypothetical protein